jgi:hypothetical protein
LVRQLTPTALVPILIARRARRDWADPQLRRRAILQMRFLLGHSSRADEIEQIAYRYLEYRKHRDELRWHPRRITAQRIEGTSVLARYESRPVILNFMHQGQFDGMFASLKRLGFPSQIVVTPRALGDNASQALRQHVRVVARGGEVVPARNTSQIAERLLPGVRLAIASDVPGRTPVSFLGRRVVGSSGAAHLAFAAQAPVVPITTHQDGVGGSYWQLHEAMEPGDFATPMELLHAVLGVHEPAILAWPEAVEFPIARWGVAADEDEQEFALLLESVPVA